MSYVGKKPTSVPLTSSDITDGIITSAKIADGSIATADIADAAVTKVKTSGVSSNPFRNIIINGDMSIAQRSTSVSSISSGTAYDTVDRFSRNIGSAGTWTISQSTTVPSGQGFAKSLKMDCTTANGSLSSNSEFVLRQNVEGQNLQYLKKGTSSAESTTLSFWVRSNKTGTYICTLYDNDNNRNISKSYTISSADTWEKKTLTFAGDTSGAFGNDNGNSLTVGWWLVAGSDFTSGTLSTTWTSSTNANRVVGQVNLADSTSNEWYITGVQLEAGTTASDFEFLPIDVNLERCQRYYEKNFDFATAPADGLNYGLTNSTLSGSAYGTGFMRSNVTFKVKKRTTPSSTFYYVTGLHSSGTTSGRWSYWDSSSWSQTNGTTSAGETSDTGMDINIVQSGLTFGYSYLVGGGWSVDAEL